MRRTCPEHLPGLLGALVDLGSGRPYLMCDEVEHGYWSPALDDPILFDDEEIGYNVDIGIPHRRYATSQDILDAGWDLDDFDA
ncbi:MAG: hypothetical protein QOD92_3395 [Acidimicrobiaceae bacterium]